MNTNISFFHNSLKNNSHKQQKLYMFSIQDKTLFMYFKIYLYSTMLHQLLTVNVTIFVFIEPLLFVNDLQTFFVCSYAQSLVNDVWTLLYGLVSCRSVVTSWASLSPWWSVSFSSSSSQSSAAASVAVEQPARHAALSLTKRTPVCPVKRPSMEPFSS